MLQLSREWLEFLREQYPKGSRIELKEMSNDPCPLPPGSVGTLVSIDDLGTFHVNWDNGRTLGLVVGIDRFRRLPPSPISLKLYMPLTADLYTTDEWGNTYDEPEPLSGYSIASYEFRIREVLAKTLLPEEAERGIMHWFSGNEAVTNKVHSVFFDVEQRDNRLWGVAKCQLIAPLSDDEFRILKEYIAGQASDGWGESFEQREIDIEDGKLYVHLWSSDNDWSIMTEEECFSPKHATELPEMCFSILPSTGELICIKRGQPGYFPFKSPPAESTTPAQLANDLNQQYCVSPSQRKAMEFGSMFGWNLPGANPATYEAKEHEQGGMTLG